MHATITVTNDQTDVAEIYVSHKELKEIIEAATYILNGLESLEE